MRAPFAGVVAERLHNPDEQVAPGDALLELFDPRSLVVVAQVPIDASRELRPGMPVEVRQGDSSVHGAVRVLVGAVTPQVLTVPVRVALDEVPHPPLLHAAVECRITTARHDAALLIPAAAVLPGGEGGAAVVMVDDDGHARRRAVDVGLRAAQQVEVASGLARASRS